MTTELKFLNILNLAFVPLSDEGLGDDGVIGDEDGDSEGLNDDADLPDGDDGDDDTNDLSVE